MGWIRRFAVSAVVLCILGVGVSGDGQVFVTAPEQAIVGETLFLEVVAPVEGNARVECALSLDDSQVQLQSLPEAQGWNVDFRGMTLVLTCQEGSAAELRLQLKLKILPVPAQTKTSVSFRFTGEDGTVIGEVTHTITVTEPPCYEHFLTALSVEGGQLAPQFHPDVLQYSVTVPVDCQQPQIHAVGAKKSEVAVSRTEFGQEGTCTVRVTVKAENGNERSYTILVTRDVSTVPETTVPLQSVSQETQKWLDGLSGNKDEGVPGWLLAACGLAGIAVGGAGGILLSQKKNKDR